MYVCVYVCAMKQLERQLKQKIMGQINTSLSWVLIEMQQLLSMYLSGVLASDVSIPVILTRCLYEIKMKMNVARIVCDRKARKFHLFSFLITNSDTPLPSKLVSPTPSCCPGSHFAPLDLFSETKRNFEKLAV